MSREQIAQALKRLRLQNGLTANQVGKMIGKSGKTVNAWENNRGQPDADILIKLCKIYNVEDILSEFRANELLPFSISEHEKKLIIAYREKPEMQAAVETLLGILPETNTPPERNTTVADDMLETISLFEKKTINTK